MLTRRAKNTLCCTLTTTGPASMAGKLLAACILALQLQLALQQQQQQQCGGGTENVLTKGAVPNDGRDDSDAFVALDQDANAGIIFMDSGVFNIAKTTTLWKPVSAGLGAAFQVIGCLHQP
jgi:hypothetical protein